MSAGASVTVLGAGSILPRAGYGCAGYALRAAAGGPVTLLDCGPGSVRALGAAGIGVEEVERVVLTHFHLDHCLDLFALAFARMNPSLARRPRLSVFGPAGLRTLVEGTPHGLGRWSVDPDAAHVEVAVDAGGRCAFEAGGLRFRGARTGHTPEALAWRVELPDGASLVYSGDSPEAPALAELARGADLFLCECSFPEGHGTPNHLTPGGAARLARAGGVARLVLTHFYPETDPEEARAVAAGVYGGPIELARDGAVYSLARSRRMGA